MTISRRRLILAVSQISVVYLAGCGAQSSTTTNPINEAATDANLIATGLQAGFAQVTASGTTVSTADTQKINGYLTTIENDATAIAKATAAPSTSTLQEIETDAEAVLTVVSPYLPNGSLILPVFNAAIDLAANLTGSAGAATNGRERYSPQEAREILAAAKRP